MTENESVLKNAKNIFYRFKPHFPTGNLFQQICKKNSSSPFHCLNSLHNFNKCRRVLDVNHLRFLFQQGGSGHLTKCNILQQIVEELILVQPMLYLGSNHWQQKNKHFSGHFSKCLSVGKAPIFFSSLRLLVRSSLFQ